MHPEYFELTLNNEKLIIFYPQFETSDGWRIISEENPFPVELTDGEAYALLLESLAQKEEETKNQLQALSGLIDDMKLLTTGPQGEKGEPFKYDDFTEGQLESLIGPKGADGKKGERGPKGEPGKDGQDGKDGKDGEKGEPGEVTNLDLDKTANTLRDEFSLHTENEIIHITEGDRERWNEAGIAEQGETDDGHYIRYEDGTQMCWHRGLRMATDTVQGNIFRSTTATWTFPREFVDNDISVSATAETYAQWADLGGSPSSDGVAVVHYSGRSNTSTYRTNLFAVGRWK